MVKTSYLEIRKSHREFKDSFELVRIRATAFTSGISPRNVVFGDLIAFEDR
jgi:hypothetical protein